jgi:outer membrane protein TolC
MSRLISVLFLVFLPALAAAQSPGSTGDILSLEAAIQLAVDNNRPLQNAKLEVDKAQEDLAAARTRRLPALETSIFAAQLLTPVEFLYARGAFGEFPGIGPVPAEDTSVTTPREPNAFVSAQVTQPLSQLKRIGLTIQSAATVRDLQRERARAQQLSVVNAVRRLYFTILQTQSALTASEDAIAMYRELDRMLQVRVAQKIALRSDALDVQARLAQEDVARITWQNTLATQKEQLNQQLGRDVRTAFEVVDAPEISLVDIDLDSAQRRALDNRPDLHEARLALQQAELDRRITQTDRIPEVSLAFSYSSYFNFEMMPKNIAALGVQVKWEPFDWGRTGRSLAVKSHSIEQARQAVREAEDRALVEINNRYRKLAEARARLNVVRITQEAAREKLRVGTNQYRLQAVVLSDVLQLRADLSAASDRYQQALLAFWTAKADFDHAAAEE